MEARFSEFSYGYAVTEELATGILGSLTGHPTFPTLKEEGQEGGGYDVKLPLAGSPLYLQFKKSHCMLRSNSEHWDLFNAPHFRMHLMPASYSMQHELLIHLELGGNKVYYIVPEFYLDDELTEYYTNRSTFFHSALFSPSDIGHLPDDGPHYVAFNDTPTGYFCSEKPNELKRHLRGESFMQSYFPAYRDRIQRIDEEFLDKLIENQMAVLREQNMEVSKLRESRNNQNGKETLGAKARFAGFLARAFFDAELFFVGER